MIEEFFGEVYDHIVNLDAIDSESSSSTGNLTAEESGIGIGGPSSKVINPLLDILIYALDLTISRKILTHC